MDWERNRREKQKGKVVAGEIETHETLKSIGGNSVASGTYRVLQKAAFFQIHVVRS